MTGKTEKTDLSGKFLETEDTGWEVYASRILCLVNHAAGY